MSKIVDDKTLNAIIKETLGLKAEPSDRIDESYVVSSKSYELNTDLLSKKAIDANLRLMQNNIDNLNEIKLDNLNEIKLDNDVSEIKLDNDVFKLNINDKSNIINENRPSNTNNSNLNNSSSNINISSMKPSSVAKTYEELNREKFDLLCNLERLEKRGNKLSRTYTMESDYEEMKREFDRITKSKEIDKSVRFQRKMLVAFITAIEFLNNKFDPLEVKLDGWSESVHENLDDYDDIFEELHEKYNSKTSLPPELRLIMMLAGSGFMFHLTQTLFKTSLPGIGDIMKQNPDLMKQFASAAASSMKESEPGLGNLMGDMFNSNSRPNPQRNNPQRNNPQRNEMRGPPNLDDILNGVNSSGNNINLDSASNYSDSDMENVRGIEIKRKRADGKKEITLDF